MGTVPYEMTAEYHLCVIPFFVLMGHLCAVAGISRDIYNTAYKWLGALRGGLSMGTIGGCAGFAAVSGDSMGTAAVMGAASIPEMKRYGYDDSLATGCVAAGDGRHYATAVNTHRSANHQRRLLSPAVLERRLRSGTFY